MDTNASMDDNHTECAGTCGTVACTNAKDAAMDASRRSSVSALCAAAENGMDACNADHVKRGVACETCQARALTRGGAVVMVKDVIRVRVEMRPAKRGELTWCVDWNATPAQALAQVLEGRGTWEDGEAGFGGRSHTDQPEIEPGILGSEPEGRNITVIVEHVAMERSPEVVL